MQRNYVDDYIKLLTMLSISTVKDGGKVGIKLSWGFFEFTALYDVSRLGEDKREKIERTVEAFASLLNWLLGYAKTMASVVGEVLERGEEEA
jgi:hypothetical protein